MSGDGLGFGESSWGDVPSCVVGVGMNVAGVALETDADLETDSETILTCEGCAERDGEPAFSNLRIRSSSLTSSSLFHISFKSYNANCCFVWFGCA